MNPGNQQADEWRPIEPEVVRLVEAVASSSSRFRPLVDDLVSAQVRNSADWILDIRGPMSGPRLDAPDGPLEVEVFVTSRADYRGEILIWITDGHLSGIEYAWITDNPPSTWPQPGQIEITA
ncbi:hypothetical protein [Smaragdicoccus niigatensis]|uniref:hypothetical protein n=1 Tax=Smaragdicoccus niigatensis TaxID=359359 RepID=UPI000373CC6A|nr:hypothetical protein [Smaragdicoccus niigatensis]